MYQTPLFDLSSTWLPPTHLPDLSSAKEIAIDTETKDPRLKDLGPGCLRKDGFVAGISLATEGWSGYFPIEHGTGGNLDKGLVCTWLAEQTSRTNCDYIFANAQYDLGWLRTLGVEVKGTICDISIAAALIDEEETEGYSLNALSRKYVKETKDEELLRAAAENFGLDAKADLWKLPANLVGAYAEKDAVLTLKVWQELKALLNKESLQKILKLEQAVTPILFEMYWRGVRLDLDYAQELNERWHREENKLLQELHMHVDEIWTPATIVRYCDKRKIAYPHTAATVRFPQGQPSITASFMENSGHPELLPLRRVRAINRTRSTFLVDTLLRGNLAGRIHPQYVQLARDDGGTRTGRLSCRNPNAQQFPKRSGLFDSKSIRKVMLPEEGCQWAKFDYWSQEPTLQVHYALLDKLDGAERVRDQFKSKIKLYTIIEKATQGKCSYDQAKQVVLARSYGQQLKSMARHMNISVEEASKILTEFDAAAPYIAQLSNNIAASARMKGFITTLLGRRLHFKHWEPAMKTKGDTPLEWKEAQAAWPKQTLQRAWIYKSLNKLIQGSAADQAKQALVSVNQVLGLPMFPVHDELSKSIAKPAEALIMKEIMETCVPLLCPAQTDMEVGPSWC